MFVKTTNTDGKEHFWSTDSCENFYMLYPTQNLAAFKTSVFSVQNGKIILTVNSPDYWHNTVFDVYAIR